MESENEMMLFFSPCILIYLYIYFQILCMCYLSPYILRFPLTWIFFPPTLLLLFISSFQPSVFFIHLSQKESKCLEGSILIVLFDDDDTQSSIDERGEGKKEGKGREKWFFFLVCTEWNVRSKWREYWKRGRRWNRNITRLSHVSLSKEKVREREGKNEEENKKRGRSSQEPLDTTRPIWDSVLTYFSLFLFLSLFLSYSNSFFHACMKWKKRRKHSDSDRIANFQFLDVHFIPSPLMFGFGGEGRGESEVFLRFSSANLQCLLPTNTPVYFCIPGFDGALICSLVPSDYHQEWKKRGKKWEWKRGKRKERGKERSWIDVFHWSDLGSERGMKGEKWDYECRRKGASGSLSFFGYDSIPSLSHSSVREFFLLFLNLQMHLQRASLEVIW